MFTAPPPEMTNELERAVWPRPGTVSNRTVGVLASPPMAGAYSLELGGGNVLLERDVGVIVRDGMRLSVDVYRPNRPGRFPAILEHIPYRKDDLRAIEDRSQNSFLVNAGFACVRLDVRGTGSSQGSRRTSTPRPSSTTARRGRVDGGAAVVHRRGGLVGRLLRRVQLHPARRPAPAGAAGDRARLRDRRPLHRRHALPRRSAERQQPARLPHRDDRDERPAAARPARRGVRPRLAAPDRGDPRVARGLDPRAARRPLLAQRLAAARLRPDRLPGADLRRLAGRLPHGRAAHGAKPRGALAAARRAVGAQAARSRRPRAALSLPGRDGAVLSSSPRRGRWTTAARPAAVGLLHRQPGHAGAPARRWCRGSGWPRSAGPKACGARASRSAARRWRPPG